MTEMFHDRSDAAAFSPCPGKPEIALVIPASKDSFDK